MFMLEAQVVDLQSFIVYGVRYLCDNSCLRTYSDSVFIDRDLQGWRYV